MLYVKKLLRVLLWLIGIGSVLVPFTGLCLWLITGGEGNNLMSLWKYTVPVIIGCNILINITYPKEKRWELWGLFGLAIAMFTFRR